MQQENRKPQHIDAHGISFGKSAGSLVVLSAVIKHTIPVKEKSLYCFQFLADSDWWFVEFTTGIGKYSFQVVQAKRSLI